MQHSLGQSNENPKRTPLAVEESGMVRRRTTLAYIRGGKRLADTLQGLKPKCIGAVGGQLRNNHTGGRKAVGERNVMHLIGQTQCTSAANKNG